MLLPARITASPMGQVVYFTHAWLGGNSHVGIQERLFKNLPAQEFITSNTRPYIEDSQYYRFKAKLTILRLAGLWADAILANELGQDLMQRYSSFASEDEQHEFVSSLYIANRHYSHFMEESKPERREVSFLLRKK